MEIIKKKFLSNHSEPLPIGEGLIFKILAKAGDFTSTLPIYIRSGETITVNWGEGTVMKYSSGVINKSFNYLGNTELLVQITTDKEDICIANQSSAYSYIKELVSWGDKPLVSNLSFLGGMFVNEPYLTNVAEDTNNVCSTLTDSRNMFSGCYELASVPQLDTSNCKFMSNMFHQNSKLEAVYGLDLSSVTDINSTTRLFASPATFNLLKKLYISNLGKSSADYFNLENCTTWDAESMLWTANHSETLTTGTKYIRLYTTNGYDEPVAVWREKGYNVIGIMD